MGGFDPARQCTPTPQSAAGVTHELTIPPQERQKRPDTVANRPVLPQATCPPSTTQSLCGSFSVALQSSSNVRSSDLLSGAPRIRILCTARYLSELNPVSWPVQPVSDLIRRRSGRKVVEARRWRGANVHSRPRSLPRAPVRPGAGNSRMASSCNVVIPSSGSRLRHPDVAATQPVDPHAAADDPAQDAEALPGDALANVIVTALHNLVVELQQLRDAN